MLCHELNFNATGRNFRAGRQAARRETVFHRRGFRKFRTPDARLELPILVVPAVEICFITFHFMPSKPTRAGVMNFVRMSASVSDFLFTRRKTSTDLDSVWRRAKLEIAGAGPSDLLPAYRSLKLEKRRF